MSYFEREWTLVQAAEQLQLAPATLRIQVGRGRLKARKVGNAWVVTQREVDLYRDTILGRPGRKQRDVHR